MFSVNTETQADVFKFLQLEVRFRDGLEKKVGLAVERQPCFQISPLQCGHSLSFAPLFLTKSSKFQ